MTTTVLYYFPGQKATIFLETFASDGYTRADVTVPIDGYVDDDGYAAPLITRVVFPDLSLAADFPQIMIKLDIGLYYFQFTLPFNGNSIGSYIVDVSYIHPETGGTYTKLYQLITNAPYGNYSVTSQ